MRGAALLLSLSGTSGLFAQNWALINPDYKYNYTETGTDVLTERISVTTTTTLGTDSVRFDLGLTARLCDTCPPGSLGGGAWKYIHIEQPSFLGPHVVHALENWYFGADSNLVLRPEDGVGSSWTLCASPFISATVSNVAWSNVLGQNDSLKIIDLSNGDAIIVAKTLGVVHWPGSLGAPGEDQELVGVHGPDLGWVTADWTAFFPYQPGDVLQYHHYHDQIWNGVYMWEDSKLTILGRTDQTESITFLVEELARNYGYDPSHVDWGSIDTTEWVVSDAQIPALRLLRTEPCSPFEGASGAYWIGDDMCGIAEHFIDQGGRHSVRPQRFDTEGHWSTCSAVQPPYMMGIDEGNAVTYPGAEQVWFTEGVGYRGHSSMSNSGYASDQMELIGAIITGDTIGHVDDDYFFLGMGPINQTGHPVSLAPSPASAYLDITLPVVEPFEWMIIESTGRPVRSGISVTNWAHVVVEDLAQGVYLVNVEQGGRSLQQRFVVAR